MSPKPAAITSQGEAKLISCAAAGIFGTECKASTHACKLPHGSSR